MVKKVYISSTFSLNMLEDMTGVFKSHICLIDEIREYVELLNNCDGKTVKTDDVEVINGFGHQSTADSAKNIYDLDIPVNRVSLSIPHQSIVYVLEYRGERLPEGCTVLPDGAELVPIRVEVV